MAFLVALGIEQDHIFCSSIEGQGVLNGSRIATECKDKIASAGLVIYIFTGNLFKNNYCVQDLGTAWLQPYGKSKSYFIFKFNDVDKAEFSGFVDDTYKYDNFDENGLLALYERLKECFDVHKKATVVNGLIKRILKDASSFAPNLLDRKSKNHEELA